MWVSGSSLLQGMFVSTSEFLGVLSVLAHVVCRLAGVLATCQFMLKTPILRTDDPSSQHRAGVTVQTVIRRFGSKEQLVASVGRKYYQEGKLQRDEAPIGDIAAAIENLLAHYETVGKRLLRTLSQEERDPTLHQMLEEGRQAHRQWVERVFAPFLLSLDPQRRARLTAMLVAVTDVSVWKLLSQDMGLDREQTAVALQELVEALLGF